MIYLRQSTASQEVLLGPFLDDTDGKTAETGLTIANTDIKIWKRGGTTEASKNSGGATHIASGRYYATLDATDTDTVGELLVNVHVSGALPVRLVCCVLEEAVFDALFASSAAGYQVPIWSSASATVNLSGTTVKTLTDAPSDSSGTTTLLSRLSSARAGYLDNINNANLASVPAFPANFAALGINASGHVSRVTLCDTLTTYTGNTPQTGDAYAIVSSGTHGNAALKTLVDDLPTNAELTSALAGADDAVLAAIAALSIPTVAAIADGVWDEVMSGHTTDGTYGGRIVRATNANVSVQITGSNHVAADVHEFQAGVITAADFADNAITSSVLAASAVSEIVVGVLTTAMTEAYRSTGAAPTVAQALFEILQNLTEFSISGTTKTAKKLDGSTTAKTYTLDSATTPTSITEAT